MSKKILLACTLVFTHWLSSCNLPSSVDAGATPDIPASISSPTTEVVEPPDANLAPENRATLTSSEAPFPLATPYSLEPAAGICGRVEGEWARMTIYADIPDPRCMQVRPEQKLAVINQTQERISVSLGRFQTHLDPGEEAHLDQPFGTYLAPGVHLLEVDPCCGGSIMLIESHIE